MAEHALGIDVGGTKIASGLVDVDGSVVHRRVERVRGPGLQAIDQVAAIARSYLARYPVAEIGVALPGGVDPATREVVAAPNLRWARLALAEHLAPELGREVRLENDANAAAWAEHRFGAGRGADSIVLVTIGTGIGGGLVVDGRLHVGHRGLGAELGHIPLIPAGLACVCGGRGCWEQYASGSALVADALRRGWRPPPFAGEDVLAAAEDGDPIAAAAVAALTDHLAHGLAVLGACVDPAQVVLGGGLGSDARIAARVEAALERFGRSSSRAPVAVVRARLGVDAGLIGVADLARRPGCTATPDPS